jgi:hypothetical protein
VGWPSWTEPDAPPLYPSVDARDLISPGCFSYSEEEDHDDEHYVKETHELSDDALFGSEASSDVWGDDSPVYDLSIRPRVKKVGTLRLLYS